MMSSIRPDRTSDSRTTSFFSFHLDLVFKTMSRRSQLSLMVLADKILTPNNGSIQFLFSAISYVESRKSLSISKMIMLS